MKTKTDLIYFQMMEIVFKNSGKQQTRAFSQTIIRDFIVNPVCEKTVEIETWFLVFKKIIIYVYRQKSVSGKKHNQQ